MSRGTKSSKLIRALHQLVPDAALSLIDERQWHSITFSGVRICVSMTLSVGHPPDFVARFKDELPEMEFDLSGQLVADIAVTGGVNCEGKVGLVIDALLLDV